MFNAARGSAAHENAEVCGMSCVEAVLTALLAYYCPEQDYVCTRVMMVQHNKRNTMQSQNDV